jgi:hypothetical protein
VLYDLGAKDPHAIMGGSMMAEVLQLEECPDELIESALESGSKHLIRIAEARRSNAHNTGGGNDA